MRQQRPPHPRRVIRPGPVEASRIVLMHPPPAAEELDRLVSRPLEPGQKALDRAIAKMLEECCFEDFEVV